MFTPASDVYEIVLLETSAPKKWFRSIVVLATSLLNLGEGPINPGGMIISVVHRESGEELFRHVEDLGDDEGHLLNGIQDDLASMTADEFRETWG